MHGLYPGVQSEAVGSGAGDCVVDDGAAAREEAALLDAAAAREEAALLDAAAAREAAALEAAAFEAAAREAAALEAAALEAAALEAAALEAAAREAAALLAAAAELATAASDVVSVGTDEVKTLGLTGMLVAGFLLALQATATAMPTRHSARTAATPVGLVRRATRPLPVRAIRHRTFAIRPAMKAMTGLASIVAAVSSRPAPGASLAAG